MFILSISVPFAREDSAYLLQTLAHTGHRLSKFVYSSLQRIDKHYHAFCSKDNSFFFKQKHPTNITNTVRIILTFVDGFTYKVTL